MGRYYSGDIEGKFWFGVQSSDDASFFGGHESEPNYIDYFFEREDLPDIQKGLNTCYEKLGIYKEKLEEFFKSKKFYNDEMLMEELKIKEKKVRELLTWYARAILGEKIKKCVQETGECNFQAEL